MPEFVQASVTIDGDNTASWSIPISSGNVYESIGKLRNEVMAYYASINGQLGLEDVESEDGTISAMPLKTALDSLQCFTCEMTRLLYSCADDGEEGEGKRQKKSP